MNYLQYLQEIQNNWRDKVITHITPKTHKVKRVKISSLPPEEQQRYNPNKLKHIGTMDPSRGVTPGEIMNLKVVNFYVATKDIEYIKNLKEGELILATNTPEYAIKYFDDKLISVKILNVPISAVKKYVSGDFSYVSKELDIEIIDVSEKTESELFELVKFSEHRLFLIELQPYLDYIKIISDGEEYVTNL